MTAVGRALARARIWIFWAAALFICFIPALFLASPAGYFPLLFLLFLTLISGLYILGLRKSLEWEEGGESASIRRGEGRNFGLVLHNRGPLVFPSLHVTLRLSDLFGGTDSALDTEMTVVPFERRELDMDVQFTHIGSYTVSVERMSIGDLMGLFSKEEGGGAEHMVSVLPKIWTIPRFPLSHQVNNEDPRARQSSEKDGMDYIGVREYAQGDPIKSIHWKLSAHAGAYMTKQLTTFGMTGLAVVLDLYNTALDAEKRMHLYDGIVEGACALCAYALRNHLDHELYYFDSRTARKSECFRRVRQLDYIAEKLPKIVSHKEAYPVEQLLHYCMSDIYGKNNVALVTSQLTPDIIELLTMIHLRGRYPSLLLVLPEGMTDDEKTERLAPLRSLDAYRIPWFAYSDPRDLERGKF